MTGKVKNVSERGFFFIKEDATGTEYFCHSSDLADGSIPFDQITAGLSVSFEEGRNSKGPRAAHALVTGR